MSIEGDLAKVYMALRVRMFSKEPWSSPSQETTDSLVARRRGTTGSLCRRMRVVSFIGGQHSEGFTLPEWRIRVKNDTRDTRDHELWV